MNGVATAISPEATPLDFGDTQVRVVEKRDVNRDKTRYVACLGNHLESGDRRQLRGIGGWAGGVWAGHSEIEGAPTLKRTHHMILRGLFCPLEMTATAKKADHREAEAYRETYLDGPGVPPFTRGYTLYPGDDLNYLQSDRFRPMGIVEITPLMGVDWNSELRKSLQHFFFPQWAEWQQGKGEIPELISDWETLVHQASGRAQYENHAIIAEQLIESINLFKTYALNFIERNRQAILSMRAANHGGQYIGWSNKSRAYALQLGMVLEDEKNMAPASSGDSTAIVAEMREDRALRKRELAEQREYNKILRAKLLGEELPEVTPEVTSKVEEKDFELIDPEIIAQESVSFGTSAIEEEDDELILAPVEEAPEVTPGCSEFNAKGEPCKGKVQHGETKCVFHGGKSQAEALNE